jgi:hypothetical protein
VRNEDDYGVGYGRPPKETQFKKGQSGNPRGRPKGSESLKTVIQEELDRKITILVKGKKKNITTRRALVRKGIHLGLTKGDVKMLRAMGALQDDALPEQTGKYNLPREFTLTFEGEPQWTYIDGEIISHRPEQSWDDYEGYPKNGDDPKDGGDPKEN